MELKNSAVSSLDSLAPRLAKLSDDIWDHPETCYKETESARLQIEALRELGFEVTENLCGIPTAFCGRFGSGKPVIGLLGEFDALSGLSQKADCFVKEAQNPGGAGHGCGHNLLGVGSIGAAAAVKAYLQASGCSGTVVYFGCPAEEGGSGKAFMARDGAFDELDCAITWHPGDLNLTSVGSMLANYQINYKFTGTASHAAAAPEHGRSALDACELMNVGVQFLREHIVQEARVHYAITDTGGYSPNVVQPTAEVLYLIRAPKKDQVQEIYERINDIARGAALMTGTKVESRFIKACSNVVPNDTLSRVLQRNLEAIGVPEYTAEERGYAAAMQATIANRSSTLKNFMALGTREEGEALRKWLDAPLYECIAPYPKREFVAPASSDVGDVSWVCPTAQIMTCTEAADTPGHSWQQVAQGKSSIAHKGTLYAAKVMAATIIDLLNDPAAIEAAKAEKEERIGPGPFVSPIPKDVVPQALGKK